MDKHFYSCQYCGAQYKPNRRYKQKFCSSSCRVNSHQRSKKLLALSETKKDSENSVQVEEMSVAGVGNAAAGALLAKGVTALLTSPENRPATKKDISNLVNTLKGRYFPIKNAPPRNDGAKAFYDLQTQTYVYLKT